MTRPSLEIDKIAQELLDEATSLGCVSALDVALIAARRIYDLKSFYQTSSDPLKSLNEEEFNKIPALSKEQIEILLKQGREEAKRASKELFKKPKGYF